MARTFSRDLLSAGAASALVGIAAAAFAKLDQPATVGDIPMVASENPDAELILLCDQLIEYERLWSVETGKSAHLRASDPGYEAAHAEQKRLQVLREPILDRVYAMPTHTLEGFRARARAIMAADYGEMERNGDYEGQLYSLMHDLAGEMQS